MTLPLITIIKTQLEKPHVHKKMLEQDEKSLNDNGRMVRFFDSFPDFISKEDPLFSEYQLLFSKKLTPARIKIWQDKVIQRGIEELLTKGKIKSEIEELLGWKGKYHPDNIIFVLNILCAYVSKVDQDVMAMAALNYITQEEFRQFCSIVNNQNRIWIIEALKSHVSFSKIKELDHDARIHLEKIRVAKEPKETKESATSWTTVGIAAVSLAAAGLFFVEKLSNKDKDKPSSPSP